MEFQIEQAILASRIPLHFWCHGPSILLLGTFFSVNAQFNQNLRAKLSKSVNQDPSLSTQFIQLKGSENVKVHVGQYFQHHCLHYDLREPGGSPQCILGLQCLMQ